MELNKVYCADNLQVMQSMTDASIDLIYIDPPFNTNKIQKTTTAQFSDSFGGLEEYLNFMRPRLQQMHRLLKETGSLFVHVDYRVVHYLKIELDKIFGSPKNFINEIIWYYVIAGNRSAKRFKKRHDTILWYAKDINKYYFSDAEIRLPYTPHKNGASYGGKIGFDEKNNKFVEKKGTNTTKTYKYYILNGKMPEDVWLDINAINASAKERVNYPNQKPQKLLERIIKAASKPDDIVADFFCGSGTTCKAAKSLNRKYLGIDSNPQAIDSFQKFC